jgi:hypothetical protein
LKDLAADALAFTSDGEFPAVVLKGDLLQGRQVLFDVRPVEVVAGLLKPSVQLLDQHQGQEAAEDVTLDGLLSLVKNGSGIEDRLPGKVPVSRRWQ